MVHSREDIKYALRAIVDGMLDDAIAERWLTGYPHTDTGMNVAVIMAGNIPMAGFFDMLCCAVTGCGIFVKHSSKDKALMEWAEAIVAGCTGANVSQLADDSVADAVIASGSDNAASFIRARFDGIAMLLRTHRISAAVIDGTESAQELSLLWQDIFTYFTLGCRNVTHIYLPVGYPPETLIEKIVSGNQPIVHRPWHGSYRQTRALKTMNGEPFFDGGYFLLCPGMQSETICQITYSFLRVERRIDRGDRRPKRHTMRRGTRPHTVRTCPTTGAVGLSRRTRRDSVHITGCTLTISFKTAKLIVIH